MAVLLDNTGSVMPVGTDTVAELVSDAPLTPIAVTSKPRTSLPPEGRVNKPVRLVPELTREDTLAPAVAEVTVTLVSLLMPAGSTSEKRALVTANGPVLVMVRLKVNLPPVLTDVTLASLVMPRSAFSTT